MLNKERLKEEIGLLKLLVTISSAVAISLTSWVFNNFDEFISLRFSIVFITMIGSIFSGIFLFKETKNKISKIC